MSVEVVSIMEGGKIQPVVKLEDYEKLEKENEGLKKRIVNMGGYSDEELDKAISAIKALKNKPEMDNGMIHHHSQDMENK